MRVSTETRSRSASPTVPERQSSQEQWTNSPNATERHSWSALEESWSHAAVRKISGVAVRIGFVEIISCWH